jgi:nicotinamide-nucleotide amidase
MRAEILAVGTELLLGQIENTNARFLSRALADLGIDVFYHVAVGDNPQRLDEAFRTALGRSDLVLVSGGLGPTSDDITRERLAEVTGRPLVLDKESLAHIEDFFRRREVAMPSGNRKQAMLPSGAVPIPNPVGTAPGVLLERGRQTVILLPGPPVELVRMTRVTVIPYLEERLERAGERAVIRSRVLKLAGIGESAAEAEIADIMAAQGNPTVAPLAGEGEVHFRITAKAADPQTADAMIAPVEAAILDRLARHVYGRDDDTLEGVIAGLLARLGSRLAVAESCTGGGVAYRLTSVPGSSAHFERGLVVYSNQAKVELAGVTPELLERHGAVSREVAAALAEGVMAHARCDFGLGVTGIAGPGGGFPSKPVGLVCFGLAGGGPTATFERRFAGGRSEVRRRATTCALELLWGRLRP